MRLKYISHPLLWVSVVFLSQFLFWLIFMPDYPTLTGAAPKYFSLSALVKWMLLFLLLITGVLVGSLLRFPKIKSEDHWKNSKSVIPSGTLRLWWKFGLFTLLMTVVGEVVYIRDLILIPGLVLEAFEKGNLAILGEFVRAQKISGLSSLNNLFTLATAIFAVIVYHPQTPPLWRKKSLRILIWMGVFVFLHAMLLAARMFLVYYALVILVTYLVLRDENKKISINKLVSVALFIILVVWIGELLRGGLAFSRTTQVPIYSWSVQVHVWERLVQGYLAADFNNALVVLDCDPSLSLTSSTMFSSLQSMQSSYHQCSNWTSAYGTVNVLALWWYDWGWSALLLAFYVGLVLGIFYRMRTQLVHFKFEGLYYLVAFPGLLSITRINYFMLTIFVLPFLYLSIFLLVRGSVNRTLEAGQWNQKSL